MCSSESVFSCSIPRTRVACPYARHVDLDHPILQNTHYLCAQEFAAQTYQHVTETVNNFIGILLSLLESLFTGVFIPDLLLLYLFTGSLLEAYSLAYLLLILFTGKYFRYW